MIKTPPHLLIAGLSASTLIAVVSSPARAQSFDCAKATTAVEQMVCADTELSKLDEQMAHEFSDARRDVQLDVIGQAAWLRPGIPGGYMTRPNAKALTCDAAFSPYTDGMQSKVAQEVRRRQFERFAAMTPAERVALAMRLGEEGLASYMATHGVDRRTAVARITETHRVGRRHSRSAAGDSNR
jgi:hypothetical protein